MVREYFGISIHIPQGVKFVHKTQSKDTDKISVQKLIQNAIITQWCISHRLTWSMKIMHIDSRGNLWSRILTTLLGH